MTHLITRQDMVDAMAQDYSADVTERIGHDWKHINAMVADQGDATMTDVALDFHMLELYLQGVCRQSYWNQCGPKLIESLAHLVGLIMRRAGGDASVALRVSFV